MRISVKDNDRGFAKLMEWQAAGKTVDRVLLDGELQEPVLIADEELGEVLVCRKDARGCLVVEGDDLATEWRRGRVEIVWKG